MDSGGKRIMGNYSARAEELEAQIIQWYQRLHRNPELGFQEWETAAFIERMLGDMEGMEVSRPCRTGVMGVLKGRSPGKTVAFRADMDALPLEELADIPYSSQKPGVMHACGHDGHVAMLLGAARMLSEKREWLAGEMRFLFQPAEEVLPGGAEQLIHGRAMEGVELVLGAHLDVLYPVNAFGLRAGPLMASSTSFQIVIEGNGGHAAFPFQTVDTVYVAAKIIESVQGVVTRNISAVDRAIITITQLQGSTASNIIPARTVLGGTMRVLDESCEERLRKRLEEVVKGCCTTWGAAGSIAFSQGIKALENSAELLPGIEQSIKKCTGATVYEDAPVLGGEDFSAYLQKAPGFYYKVGAKPENVQVYPHHNPYFTINLKSLAKGAAACAAVLTDAVQRPKQ